MLRFDSVVWAKKKNKKDRKESEWQGGGSCVPGDLGPLSLAHAAHEVVLVDQVAKDDKGQAHGGQQRDVDRVHKDHRRVADEARDLVQVLELQRRGDLVELAERGAGNARDPTHQALAQLQHGRGVGQEEELHHVGQEEDSR